MSWEFCDYLYPMQLLLPAIYAVMFILLIRKMNFFLISGITRLHLILLFTIVLGAAAASILVYKYYYVDADFNSYFSDSTIMVHNLLNKDQLSYPVWGSFEETPFTYGSKIIIVLNAILHLFSFGNIYVHFVFFSFFTFIGLVALLKTFLVHFPHKNQVIIGLFFIPGVLFWSSEPLKEPVIIAISGLLIYYCDFGLQKIYTFRRVILIFVLILLLSLLKLYVLMALLPGLLCNIIISRTQRKALLMKYIGITGTFVLLALILAMINPDLNVLKLISDKQAKAISEAKGGVFLANKKNFISLDYQLADSFLRPVTDSSFKIADGSNYLQWELENMRDTTFVTNSKDTSTYYLLYKVVPAKSLRNLKRIKPNLKEFVFYIPTAFFNTLLTPGWKEIRTFFHMACAVENMLIILLILSALFFFDKQVLQKKEIIVFCLVFAVVLYVLIGITTPAIGAMVRYKTIAELFLASACLIMIDTGKLKRILFRK
jgi:hypothetical protein